MASNLVTVSLLHDSGLAEDTVVNAFSFNTAGTKVQSEAAAIATELQDFYREIDDFLSIVLTGTARVRFYDRADATPRVPWEEITITFTPSASSLPLEVALCLSFKAANVSGQPPARRRGRVFIGPLAQGALSNTTGFPTAGVQTAMATAGAGLLAASNATADWSWAIWSSVDNASREVSEGWIDNAFDTQRRRGIKATTRTAF